MFDNLKLGLIIDRLGIIEGAQHLASCRQVHLSDSVELEENESYTTPTPLTFCCCVRIQFTWGSNSLEVLFSALANHQLPKAALAKQSKWTQLSFLCAPCFCLRGADPEGRTDKSLVDWILCWQPATEACSPGKCQKDLGKATVSLLPAMISCDSKQGNRKKWIWSSLWSHGWNTFLAHLNFPMEKGSGPWELSS